MKTPTIREANAMDIPEIVALLADDERGRAREGAPDDPRYIRAFAAMQAQAGNRQYVLVGHHEIIGCAQMTVISGLSHAGLTRALIEGVRISRIRRGQGLGRMMIRWLVEKARTEGCALVQLTSNAARTDARRFYESLGFEASHVGFKLAVSPAEPSS